jgi:Helix-turn-helix domain
VNPGEVPDGFWPALAALLLHPLQLQIIEAMRWIDRPLSVSELVQVFFREHRLSTIAYHVRRLSELGALRAAGKRQPPRGSIERFYRLGLAEE